MESSRFRNVIDLARRFSGEFCCATRLYLMTVTCHVFFLGGGGGGVIVPFFNWRETEILPLRQ